MQKLALALSLFLVFFPTAHAQTSRQETLELVGRFERLEVETDQGIALNKARIARQLITAPRASMAIIAAGGGLAAFLSSQMNSDIRAAFVAAGVVGAAWCLDSLSNADECEFNARYLSLQWKHLNERIKAKAEIAETLARLRRGLAGSN